MKLACFLLHAAAFSAIALSAVAQTPPPAGGMDHGQMRAHLREQMQARRQQRAADLHLVLAIRPDQEGAWSAFQAAMTPSDHHMGQPAGHAMGQAGAQAGMTTPQKLDRMDARMARREEMMRKHAAAVRSLYSALSPEQQRVFDALGRLRGGMHGGPGMHGMHGGMEGRMAWRGHDGHDGAPPPQG